MWISKLHLIGPKKKKKILKSHTFYLLKSAEILNKVYQNKKACMTCIKLAETHKNTGTSGRGLLTYYGAESVFCGASIVTV